MPSYIPEQYYGAILDDKGRWTGEYGLMPWPEHARPRSRPTENPSIDGTTSTPAQNCASPQSARVGAVFLTVSPKDRIGIASTIENLINMLDDLDGDPDLEPSLAGVQGVSDDREGDEGCWAGEADLEASLGWANSGSQFVLDASADGREEENEHGGDIQDEPHDMLDQGDNEPFLGWVERCAQLGVGVAGWNGGDACDTEGWSKTRFDGDGHLAGKTVLRELKRRRPDVRQEHIGGSYGIGRGSALVVDGLTITGAKGFVLPDEVTILQPVDSASRSFAPDDEGMFPEIDLRAHYRAAHESRT